MFKEIMFHELRNIILSKKVTISFTIAALLMLLSVALGISNYTAQMRSYNTLVNLNEQQMREAKNWMRLSSNAIRKPSPVQIFVSGVNFDIGRFSHVSSFEPVSVNHSVYSDDPFYSVFRFLDFSFITVFVLSLFILVFTYDAVNGEAENGTLKLVFSNPVPRAVFLLGKAAGIWCGILIPLLVPMLLSLALVMISGISLTSGDYMTILGIFGMVLLFCTFFVLLGLLLSVLIKRPSVSFLSALAAWMLFTCIIPRAGILLAGQLLYVPGIQELKGGQEQYEKQKWAEYTKSLQVKWLERESSVQKLPFEEQKEYRDKYNPVWSEEDENARQVIQKDMEQHFTDLLENLKNSKRQFEKLALFFARFSPVASFQLTVMDMTGSDIGMKNRFEDAISRYKKDFTAFKDKKQKEAGTPGGIRIEFNSNTGIKIDAGRDKGTLDISGVPRFQSASIAGPDSMSSFIINGGLLAIMSLALFGVAFTAFLKFDMR